MPNAQSVSTEQSDLFPRGRSLLVPSGVASLIAAGYASGYLLRPGGAGEQALHSFATGRAGFHGSLVYLIAAGVALLLLAALLRSTSLALWRRNPFAGRQVKPIAAFVEEAKARQISLRVAREAYHLLQHHYPRPMCIDMNDNLRRDLRLTPGIILALRSGLLGRTDRVEQSGVDEGSIVTVRQLLESVEAAPKNGVDRAKVRQRVTDLPFAPRPVVENIEFTAESQLADPDFMRRQHFQWLRRRAADYLGYRSRVSDALGGDEGRRGPFRRANELSKRLSIRQEAGRLAKEAAAKQAAAPADGEAEFGDASEATAYHGY